MQRRGFLKGLLGTASVTAVGSEAAVAADTQLEPGTWYDATVDRTVDGDTFDVTLDSDGTEYNVRTIGLDTPEASGNTRYENVAEWEGIEDATHLENWGNEASEWAKAELPAGTSVQIAVDEESAEEDVYGRLLAKIRYDRTGDGSMDTVYNRYAVERGYARVYSASMTNTDEYWDAEAAARESGLNVWGRSDPANTTEVRDNDVARTFHPNGQSVRTTEGAVADARVPVWAESEATQSTNSSDAVSYDGDVPLAAVDAGTNLALLGSQPIQEDLDDVSDHLEHFVFLTNLVDSLTDGDRSGMVLVDGGHRQFDADHSVSAEDTVYYQRYLEGQGIELAGVNALTTSSGPDLAEARGLVVSSPMQSFTSEEVTAVSEFVADGGAVVLLGSAASTASQQSNLNDLAAGLGTDLRLNDDAVTDATNNVADDGTLVTSANHNTTDFSLWTAYSDSGASPGYVVAIDDVTRNADTLNAETVTVTNDGSDAVDFSGWTLENGDGDAYAFPDGFSLAAGDSAVVHTGSGSDSSTDLYWGASTFRWDVRNDTATLYDADGDVAQDASWSVPDLTIPALSEDGETLTDEWVDVRNEHGESVDLSGYTLEDEAGNTYQFPDGFSLADGTTVRVHTGDGTDSDTDLYWGRGSAVWNDGGDTATLRTAGGDVVRDHTYPAPYSLSIPTIQEDGDETLEYVDVANDGDAVLDLTEFTLADEAGYTYTFPDGFALEAGATVRVHTGDGTDSESDLYWGYGIPVWNDDGDTAYLRDDNGRLAVEQSTADGGTDSKIAVSQINEDGATLNDEWVDFTNTGSTAEDLAGWTVEDEADHTYQFPDGFSLAADATVRLHTGDGTDSDTDLYWGSGTAIWNNGGDTVYLYEADGTLHTSESY